MIKYRTNLPQLSGGLFLTDGGMETTFIFHDGIDLNHFAAIDLLNEVSGYETLLKYYKTYIDIAKKNHAGFVLESATWRASRDWGEKLGYAVGNLSRLNKLAIKVLEELRDEYESAQTPMVISGCVGPRGDGYSPDNFMSADEAERYHREQIKTFSETSADMISAMTMTYVEEAIGIVNAATSVDMPVVISFTVETDGRLPSGQSLQQAIEQIDAETDFAVAYYMVNCAHPTHFEHTLSTGSDWLQRIKGIRANASAKSHAELDEMEELDDGNPEEFGSQYQAFRKNLQQLNVLGGCCGTDHRHIEAICNVDTAVILNYY
jgi:S-methylmethionine-dependent homocysteine/selenocysteine methylase